MPVNAVLQVSAGSIENTTASKEPAYCQLLQNIEKGCANLEKEHALINAEAKAVNRMNAGTLNMFKGFSSEDHFRKKYEQGRQFFADEIKNIGERLALLTDLREALSDKQPSIKIGGHRVCLQLSNPKYMVMIQTS